MENSYGKINILLQTYISRGEVDSFSLISDLSYVAQVRKTQPLTNIPHIQVLDKWSFYLVLRFFRNHSEEQLGDSEEMLKESRALTSQLGAQVQHGVSSGG